MIDSTIADRVTRLNNCPIPRKIRRRRAFVSDPVFMLGVAWLIFFGVTSWYAFTLVRVSWFGTDIPGEVRAINEHDPQAFGGYREATILMSINGQSVEFQRKLTSSSSLKLQVGDKLIVRCLPHAPLFYPLIVSHAEGTGWAVAWRLFLLFVVLGFLPLCLLVHHASQGERLLLAYGQAAIGRITTISKTDTGEVASVSYTFTVPEFPETPFHGVLSIAATADSSSIQVMQPLIVLYDPESPQFSTAYDDLNGTFEIVP